jgi:hypothetical protein
MWGFTVIRRVARGDPLNEEADHSIRAEMGRLKDPGEITWDPIERTVCKWTEMSSTVEGACQSAHH